jgi:Ca2+-binding EF-hand superfamily protein
MFGCGGFFDSCGTSDHVDDHDDRALKWANALSFGEQTPEFKRLNSEREELLHGLFEIADQNDNGSLDIDELRKIMPNAEVFLSVVDTSHDSVISMQEFKAWSDAELMDYIPADHVVRLNKLIRLARCGKRMRNGEGEIQPADVFSALDMNGDQALSLDEIDTVLGADAPHFVGPLRNIEKDGAISQPDFVGWCEANPEDFKKLLSMLLEINEQALSGIMQLYSKFANKVVEADNANKK